MIGIVLVDDQPLVRQGLRLRLRLEPELAVIGEADGASARERITCLKPDVVVMDIAMPTQDGIVLIRELRRQVPETAIVVLTLYSDPEIRARVREAGAWGLVEKHQGEVALLSSIRAAAKHHHQQGRNHGD
jgi:DNA-binding NarL/FixJ family response regulator